MGKSGLRLIYATTPTEGALTTSDLHNSAHYEGLAVGVNVNTGQQAGKHVVNGAGVGVGQDSGSAQGTTTAGISGIAGDQSVRTGDATGSERTFDCVLYICP